MTKWQVRALQYLDWVQYRGLSYSRRKSVKIFDVLMIGDGDL